MTATKKTADDHFNHIDQSDDMTEKSSRIDSLYYSMTDNNTIKTYAKWAETWERDHLKLENGYKHPEILAEKMSAVMKKEDKILDICCGTGLGGLALQKLGFLNLDGIDGCQEMLDKAIAKNIYKNTFVEFITDKKLASIDDGEYDAILTSGSFVPGHLNASHLRTLARTVKSGGYMGLCMRKEFLQDSYLNGLEDRMQDLVNEGVWKIVKREEFPFYHDHHDGVFFLFQRV